MGDVAAGVVWSGLTGIMMTAWRRSLVTITATGLARLEVGELMRMLARTLSHNDCGTMRSKSPSRITHSDSGFRKTRSGRSGDRRPG